MKDLKQNRVTGTRPKSSGAPRDFKPSKTAERVKAALVATSVLICAAAVGAGVGVGVRQVHTFFTTSPYFAVKEIEVSGTEKLDRNNVLSLAGLKEGQNIFEIDSDKAVAKISANPWIKGVTVRKQFPDRIVIRVVERKAGAMVRNSEFWLVDEDGEIFKKAEWADGMDYPVVTVAGDTDPNGVNREALQKALTLLRMAGNSGQLPASKISEVIVAADGAMTLFTSGPSKIELGSDDLKKQWAVLETVLSDARNNGMTAVSVNLNYPSGAAAKLVPAGPKTILADSREAAPIP